MVALGNNLLPWLQGETLERVRRMIEYFLLNNQIRRATANVGWFGQGVPRALGSPLRCCAWRLRNNHYSFPWELQPEDDSAWLTSY